MVHANLPKGILICPNCRAILSDNSLVCSKCQYEVKKEDSILIFTDDPDLNLDGDDGKYVGYEHIGEAYDAGGNCVTSPIYRKFGELVSEIVTPDGLCLDLGAGTGKAAVTIGQARCKVIAGDISRTMLSILVRAALEVGALPNIMACRMNAFDIPIASNTVDTVVVNELLHLVSEPERVVNEAKRVLRPGGRFVTYSEKTVDSQSEDTGSAKLFQEVTRAFLHEYWDMMRKRGQHPTHRLGWFGRNIVDEKLSGMFAHHQEYCGDDPVTYKSDYKVGEYIHRLRHSGFSDQVCVDDRISIEICDELESRYSMKYGSDFKSIANTSFSQPWLSIYGTELRELSSSYR